MTSESKRNLAVGSFTLLALAGLLTMTFLIRGGLWSNDVTYYSDFSNVSGLEVSSPVLVSGVRAGRVTRIQARKSNPPIRVYMEIDPSHEMRFNAEARIVQQGFIGDKRIEINPGSQDSALLPANGEIKGVDPFDLEKTFIEANAIVADVRDTVKALKELVTDDQNRNALVASLQNLNQSMEAVTRILQDNEASIKTTMTNVADLSGRLQGMEERASKVLESADARVNAVGGEAEATMREFREAMAELRPKVMALADSLAAREQSLGGNLDSLVSQLNTEIKNLSDPLDRTTRSLNSIMEKIDRGDGTIGLLVNDPTPFRHLSQSVEALKNALMGANPRVYDTRLDYVKPAATTPSGTGTKAP